MKCQNCGKNEVSFHYSSSVNGSVTEAHLCAECASKSGYDMDSLFDVDRVMGSFMPSFFGQGAGAGSLFSGFFPFVTPMLGSGEGFAPVVRFQPFTPERINECSCGKIAPEVSEAEVDDEMKKRREVNMLREQMRIAAESDDFEKAIELREKIKGMEAQ